MSKRILVGALGAACLFTSPAMAAGPCPATVLADDATGDAKFYNALEAPASTDILQGSIRTADRKTFVTFKVRDLTKAVPPYSTGLGWYFEYTTGGAAVYVNADLAPDGTVSFGSGTDGQSYTPTGVTTGTFDEATDTISIQLPGLTSATKRYELTTTRFATYGAVGAATPIGISAALLPSADAATSDEHTTTPCSTTPSPAA